MSDVSSSQSNKLKATDVLYFKAQERRPLYLEEIRNEFSLMQTQLKLPLTAEVAARVCEKSGSHLLKMVSPRSDGDHACLYFEQPESNRRPKILPSTNAPDIPFCKVLYRPLEIVGYPTRCVVDDILNPDDASKAVLDAFAIVFGQDVLDGMRAAFLERPKRVTKLAAGEFPIIFVPHSGGGDVQITPVSPAHAFMGMKNAISPFFEKQAKDGPKIARGKFQKQFISSKPQNISGAIGGPRTRLEATMPPVMEQLYAEVYRYVRGGKFPRFRVPDIHTRVLRYADMLDKDANYNDKNTRAVLDRTADQLIRDARAFIDETVEEARNAAIAANIDPMTLGSLPQPALVLLRRYWPDDKFALARKALSSAHFEHRLTRVDTDLETFS